MNLKIGDLVIDYNIMSYSVIKSMHVGIIINIELQNKIFIINWATKNCPWSQRLDEGSLKYLEKNNYFCFEIC